MTQGSSKCVQISSFLSYPQLFTVGLDNLSSIELLIHRVKNFFNAIIHTIMYICMILYSLQTSDSQPWLHIGIAQGAVKYRDAWVSQSIWAAIIKYQRLVA